MPAWYVHMEAAHETAKRLRDGDVPPGFPIDVTEAQDIGEICHTWRNYLALGSIGPDLFYMLPDYAKRTDSSIDGPAIRNTLQWVLSTWYTLDEEIVSRLEYLSPIGTDLSQIGDQIAGGLPNAIGDALTNLAKGVNEAVKGLVADMGDWFGVLSSGPPQAYPNSAFYWADIFHYRRTYQFPFVLFRQAHEALDSATTDSDRFDAQTRLAFAVGWLTHCGTDVTGHPLTNAKSGGPFRDHWQRHHLVELHFDSQNYSARNSGPNYGEIGTSAMHFWVAFRARDDGPYAGRIDAPAYDYFTGFPSYDDSDGPTPAAERHALFDLDTGDLPGHLVDALLAAMTTVYPVDGAKILTQDPAFSAADASGQADGRPNSEAMAQMWEIVYRYMKLTGSDGLAPRRPSPPDWITDHDFPRPPGSVYGVDDDPARGADVDGDHDFTWLDLVLAILAWTIYVIEIVVYLITFLPSLAVDLLTKWFRNMLYDVQVGVWNLYILSRRLLVMSGFLIPKPEELDLSLTTLGIGRGDFDIRKALDDPLGDGFDIPSITEPSGRPTNTSARNLDREYPRNVVRDQPDHLYLSLSDLLTGASSLHYANETIELRPSEWLAPWRYPLKNQAGEDVPPEAAAVHSGPYVAGDTGSILLPGPPGDPTARDQLEQSKSPGETFAVLDQLFLQDKHLGGPVDYSLYLVGRMIAERANDEFGVPDFNLDSDRGYAWRCWDYDRHNAGVPTSPPDPPKFGAGECVPDLIGTPQSDFRYLQPCTPPHFFHADRDNPRRLQPDGVHPLEAQWYDPKFDLRVHYLGRHVQEDPPVDGPDPCTAAPVPQATPTGPDWTPGVWDAAEPGSGDA